MAGKTLDLSNIVERDQLGTQISDHWSSWDGQRSKQKDIWAEVRNYVFATDTTTTTNSQLPWKNKTTTPKLCQIRENLFANYMGTLFPKRKWLTWKSLGEVSVEKANNIVKLMLWQTSNPRFKREQAKLLYDWIDTGNCFVQVGWEDERVKTGEASADKAGFVGAVARRISPYDIVFNPMAPSFEDSPKIIRSLMTLGEIKKLIEQVTADEQERAAMQEVYDYLIKARRAVSNHTGSFSEKNLGLQIDGFGSFDSYFKSGYVELLTFYGDIFDQDTGELLQNYKIIVVDRCKVFLKEQDNSFLGKPKIHHVAWRERPDNLWGMGPLENLIGLQYRIDHVENLKADAFDFMVAPMLKVKGYVEPFEWKPFGQVHVGDEGDVLPMPPDTNILSANTEIAYLSQQMEEMAGAPKESLGFRQPGEKTAYEVRSLENAASRIYQIKSTYYEENLLEPLLNSMLEETRKKNVSLEIVYNDPNFNTEVFEEISPNDIVGNGTVRPMGARHFAEKAEIVQNLTNFSNSNLAKDPLVISHFSGVKIARMLEEVLDLKDYEIFEENVRIAEEADMQRMIREQQEAFQMETGTAKGISPDDVDLENDIPPAISEGEGA